MARYRLVTRTPFAHRDGDASRLKYDLYGPGGTKAPVSVLARLDKELSAVAFEVPPDTDRLAISALLSTGKVRAYDRIAAPVSETQLPGRERVGELGDLMLGSYPWGTPEIVSFPAAYTYLGPRLWEPLMPG